MATAAEIREDAAKLIRDKIAEINTAEQTLLLGGKFVSVGGSQYSQEGIEQLRRLRNDLCNQAITLARKGG